MIDYSFNMHTESAVRQQRTAVVVRVEKEGFGCE